jgi:hypothetical protein
MLTMREAKQRAGIYGASIVRVADYEVRCFLNEWNRSKRIRCEYFTTDLEDAVLTCAAMRRSEDQST